jgi:hypothetical protein
LALPRGTSGTVELFEQDFAGFQRRFYGSLEGFAVSVHFVPHLCKSDILYQKSESAAEVKAQKPIR